MLQLYKPNTKNTGHAASFSFNSKQSAFFVQFIKQVSAGDGSPGSGSFKGGDKTVVKFSPWEVGNILDSFVNSVQWKTVHSTEERKVSITTGPYFLNNDTSKVAGYSISVMYKENNVDKRFGISFNAGERQTFIQYLKFSLEHIFAAQYAASKKAFETKNKLKQSQPVANQEVTGELAPEDKELF